MQPYHLINSSDFIIKNHPVYNPLSQRSKRISYWREQKRRCMEGYWSSGVWMPGELYMYVNNWTIEVDNENLTSSGKILSRPWLRDLDWDKAYIYSEAFGFSGFENDKVYTCNFRYAPENVEESLKRKFVTPEQVSQYTYLTPRKYLDRWPLSSDLGKPLYHNPAKNIIDIEARGGGKDLEASTLIHGINGSYPISDVKVGDKIFGADGKLTTVTQRRDFTNQLQYKVTFSDGRSIECGGGHLWTVYRRQRNGHKKITLELQDIYKDYKIGKRGDSRYMIPMCEPIEYEKKELPIDPYYFGLWLGDGNSHNTGITTIDAEIVEHIKSVAKQWNMPVKQQSEMLYTICPDSKTGSRRNPLLQKLRTLNVLKNKHIPDVYLQSSPEQRLALLQGLMDSDGYSDNRHIEFTTSYDGLKKTVPQLIHSLGIRCKIRKKKTTHKTALRISLLTDLPVFRLQRKLQNVGITTSSYAITNRTKSTIVDIQPTSVKPSVCIAVDNKDSLFVAGDYIVTHNSYWSTVIIGHNFLFDGSHDYDAYMENKLAKEPMVSQTLIGAINTAYSWDLLGKFLVAKNYLPGMIEFGGKKYPSPLDIGTTGTLQPGTKPLVSKKSGSKLHHRSFNDSHTAGNGTRPSRVLLEEIGFFHRLIPTLGALYDTVMAGSRQFGSIMMFGTGGDMEGGACVCAGSKVYTSDGRLINVEDLTKQDGTIGFDYENQQVLSQSIPWIQPPSKKQCVEIKFTSGRTIRCSTDHPILFSKWENFRTVKDIGRDENGKRIRKYSKKAIFKEAGKLEVGEQVALADTIDIWPTNFHPHARLIGLLVGDGNYSARTIPIHSTCDKNINQYVEDNYDTTVTTTYVTTDNQIYKEQRIRGIMPMIRELGLYGQTKHNKRSPNQLFSWNKQTVAEYIGGYFDADGSVTNNRIELTSICRPLLDDLQLLLQKFGIHSTIRKRKGGKRMLGAKEITYLNFYVLHIKDAESIIKFAANITLLSEHKSFAILKAVEHHSKVKPCKAENLPGLRFDTIKSITDIGMQPIYNFQADHTHTYLVEGVVTHNTLAAQQVFYSPDSFNCLTFEDKWENRGKIGYFVPATEAINDYKFGPNKITDLEYAEESLAKVREKKRLAPSGDPYNSELQNRPLVPSEAFLDINANKFPQAALKDREAELVANPKIMNAHWIGKFSIDSKGNLRWKASSDLRPLREYPPDKVDVEGAIEIFVMPRKDGVGVIQKDRYIASLDPVDDDDVEGSLQSGFIFDMYTERIVAEYTGRTYNVEDFYEGFRRLLMFYNATCNYENTKKGFYGYMKQKNSLHMLCKTPDIIYDKDLAITRGEGNKSYGTPAVPALLNYGTKLYESWLKKQATFAENGVINASVLPSLGLIRESKAYNPGGNFDRVSSMKMLFILYADRIVTMGKWEDDPMPKENNLANDPFFTDNWSNHLRANQELNNYMKVYNEPKYAA